MNLVGYGDIVPRSHLGRAIIFFPIVFCFLIFSFTIVSVFKTSFFNENENKAFTILRRMQLKQDLKFASIELVKISLLFYALKKNVRRRVVYHPDYPRLRRKFIYYSKKKRSVIE